jgi:hypothetical protein
MISWRLTALRLACIAGACVLASDWVGLGLFGEVLAFLILVAVVVNVVAHVYREVRDWQGQ